MLAGVRVKPQKLAPMGRSCGGEGFCLPLCKRGTEGDLLLLVVPQQGKARSKAKANAQVFTR